MGVGAGAPPLAGLGVVGPDCSILGLLTEVIFCDVDQEDFVNSVNKFHYHVGRIPRSS